MILFLKIEQEHIHMKHLNVIGRIDISVPANQLIFVFELSLFMTIKFHPTTTICISPWCINYINEFVYIPLEFHINIEWSIYISIYWYEIYLSTLHVIQTVLLKITANKSEREKRWINVLLTKQRRQKKKKCNE